MTIEFWNKPKVLLPWLLSSIFMCVNERLWFQDKNLNHIQKAVMEKGKIIGELSVSVDNLNFAHRREKGCSSRVTFRTCSYFPHWNNTFWKEILLAPKPVSYNVEDPILIFLLYWLDLYSCNFSNQCIRIFNIKPSLNKNFLIKNSNCFSFFTGFSCLAESLVTWHGSYLGRFLFLHTFVKKLMP